MIIKKIKIVMMIAVETSSNKYINCLCYNHIYYFVNTCFIFCTNIKNLFKFIN